MKEIIAEIERRGIREFDIFYEKKIREDVGFVQNEPEKFEEKREEGIGLRIIKQGKRGFTYANSLENVKEIVERAVQTSEYGKEVKINFPEKESEKRIKIFYDVKWDIKERLERGKEFIDRITSKYKDLKVNVEFSNQLIERKILNSKGLEAGYTKSIFHYYIQVSGLTPTGIVFTGNGETNLKPDFDFDKTLEHLMQLLERCKVKEKMKSGNFPVIFAPPSLGFFGWSIILGINGKNVEKGITPLKNLKGEKIFSDKITILNDPEREDLAGSLPFDDEGMKAERFKFIEKGILKDFLTDLETSERIGIKPRGNGIRDSFENLPHPSFTNFVIEKGEKKLQEIIKEIEYGLIVYETIGAGQSNMLAGEYSFNVGLGFLIKNGEVKGRVKDAMVSGNIYHDFKNILHVSKDTKKFSSSEIPYICVQDVKVDVKN